MTNQNKTVGDWDFPDAPAEQKVALKITRGVIKGAQRVVIYGPEGVGKSTLASKFPKPLFFDAESGTKSLDVDRVTIESYAELIHSLEQFSKDTMGYKTIVIDTIDWVEMMMMESLCAEHRLNSIEEFGYGKGYTHLAEKTQRFLSNLSEFINRGIHILLLGHSVQAKFELPGQQGSYDQFTIDLHKKVLPIVKEWSDDLFFVNWETILKDKQGDPRGNTKLAVGGRQGKIYTQHSATYDAKNRHGLPPELPLDYSSIAHIFELSAPVEKENTMSENDSKPEAVDPGELSLADRILRVENALTQHKIKGYRSEADFKKVRVKIGGGSFVGGMTDTEQERYFQHLVEVANENISQ
jgi:hypothetical protein